MYPMYPAFTSQEEFHPFVEACFPKVKLQFAYFWLHYQARKRRFIKKNERSMRMDEMYKMRREIEDQPIEEKQRWAHNLLKKLKKDIKPEYRDEFIKAMKGFDSDCVISNPDQKQKMRRIDCLRQADKVWRLDLVMMILFHAAPLESTDGERLSKIPKCKEPSLCVNPSHIGVVAKELDLFISKNLYQTDPTPGPNMLLSGVISESDFDQYNNISDIPSPLYSRQLQLSQHVNIRCTQRVHPYQYQRSNVADNKLSMYEGDGASYSDTDSGVCTPPKLKNEASSLSPIEVIPRHSIMLTKAQLFQQQQTETLYLQHINRMISEGDKLGFIPTPNRPPLHYTSNTPWQLNSATSNVINEPTNQHHSHTNFNNIDNASLAFNCHPNMFRTFGDKRINANHMAQNTQEYEVLRQPITFNATCNTPNATISSSYNCSSPSSGLYSQTFEYTADGSCVGAQQECANGYGTNNMMQDYAIQSSMNF